MGYRLSDIGDLPCSREVDGVHWFFYLLDDPHLGSPADRQDVRWIETHFSQIADALGPKQAIVLPKEGTEPWKHWEVDQHFGKEVMGQIGSELPAFVITDSRPGVTPFIHHSRIAVIPLRILRKKAGAVQKFFGPKAATSVDQELATLDNKLGNRTLDCWKITQMVGIGISAVTVASQLPGGANDVKSFIELVGMGIGLLSQVKGVKGDAT